MSDPAQYRTREEVSKVRAERDPIDKLRDYISENNSLTSEEIKGIDTEVKEVISAAANFAQESPRPSLNELYTDVII